ncbi:MAG TPA: hypothetical protein VGM73_07590 [Candidatus Didemnitutus sp.]|jgi:hypothetical protein
MRKLVWFVLAAFCAVLGQTQAVESQAPRHRSCCPCAGHCHMPDCASALPRAPEFFLAGLGTKPAERSRAAVRKRLVCSAVFPSDFDLRPTRRDSAARVAPATLRPVRLFAAHCAFLI